MRKKKGEVNRKAPLGKAENKTYILYQTLSLSLKTLSGHMGCPFLRSSTGSEWARLKNQNFISYLQLSTAAHGRQWGENREIKVTGLWFDVEIAGRLCRGEG